MNLTYHLDNATPEQLARGVAAAEDSFRRSGVEVQAVWPGWQNVKMWELADGPRDSMPPKADFEAVRVVWAANEAACLAAVGEDALPPMGFRGYLTFE